MPQKKSLSSFLQEINYGRLIFDNTIAPISDELQNLIQKMIVKDPL